MAVPKHKTSKASAASRKAMNMRLEAPVLSVCGTCGNLVVAHRVCPKCGFYRGKQIIEQEKMV